MMTKTEIAERAAIVIDGMYMFKNHEAEDRRWKQPKLRSL